MQTSLYIPLERFSQGHMCVNNSLGAVSRQWDGQEFDVLTIVGAYRLPVYIRAEPDIARFKNILKTYFFRLAFDLLG